LKTTTFRLIKSHKKMFKKKSRPQTAKRKSLDSSDESDGATDSLKASAGTVTASELKKRKKAGAGGPIGGSTGPAVTTSETKDEDKLHVTFAESGTAASLASNMATRRIDIDGVLEEKKPGKEEEILAGEDAERATGGYQGLSGYKDYMNNRDSRIRY
jgi:hypothetical protein